MRDYDEKYKRVYGTQAKAYDGSRFGTIRGLHSKQIKNDVISDILNARGLNRKDIKVIDLATGTGRIAHELVKMKFSRVYSADITSEMLEVSKENLDSKYHGKLSWTLADMKDLPFQENSFDVAIVGSFFYLIPQREYNNYTRDIRRILRSGGLFICEVSNSLAVFNPKNLTHIMYHKYWKKLDVKSYVNPLCINRIFESFELEDVIGVDYPMLTSRYGFYKRYSYFLGHSPITKYLGGKLVLVLRKT